jgi:hypothetical protein
VICKARCTDNLRRNRKFSATTEIAMTQGAARG